MAASLEFTDLPEEVLTSISEFSGVLGLHQLFKCGNRLLTCKLTGTQSVTRYSNVSEYGRPILWLDWVICQLRGLKSLIIENDEVPPFQPFVQSPMLWNLPSTMEEISIRSVNSLEAWYKPGNAEGEFIPFNFVQNLPNLRSLKLTHPDPEISYIHPRNTNDMREKWLLNHLRFLPPTLTSFHVDWMFNGIFNALKYFPPTLESLGFGMDDDTPVPGISWLWRFTDLCSLTIYGASAWTVSAKEFLEDGTEIGVHTTLKHLNLPRLAFFQSQDIDDDGDDDRTAARIFFDHFIHLETLSGPSLFILGGEIQNLTNLQKIEVSFPLNDEEFESTTQAYYPPSTTYIKASDGEECEPDMDEDLIHWVLKLPVHLVSLSAPILKTHIKLLPRSITRLLLDQVAPEDDIIPDLPPNLTTLGLSLAGIDLFPRDPANGVVVGHGFPYDASLMGTLTSEAPFCEFLEKLPDTLQTVRDCDVKNHKRHFVRTPNVSKSLGFVKQNGWTSMAHAIRKFDIEGMQACLAVIEGSLEMKWFLTGIWDLEKADLKRRNVEFEETKLYFPEAALDWLRMRGVISCPHRVGSVSNKCLSEHAFEHTRLDVMPWMKKHLNLRDWHSMAKDLFLYKFCNDDAVTFIEWFHDMPFTLELNASEAMEAMSSVLARNQLKFAFTLGKLGYTAFHLANFLHELLTPVVREKMGPMMITGIIEALRSMKLKPYAFVGESLNSSRTGSRAVQFAHWQKHSRHFRLTNPNPAAILEVLLLNVTYQHLALGILDLIKYLADDLGYDLSKPSPITRISMSSPHIYDYFNRLSCLAIPDTYSAIPPDALYNLVAWLLAHNIPITAMTRRKRDSYDVYTLNVTHVAAEMNHVPLLTLLANHGFNFEEKGGPLGLNAFEMMNPYTRPIISSLVSNNISAHNVQ